jgi:hypothetical protein
MKSPFLSYNLKSLFYNLLRNRTLKLNHLILFPHLKSNFPTFSLSILNYHLSKHCLKSKSLGVSWILHTIFLKFNIFLNFNFKIPNKINLLLYTNLFLDLRFHLKVSSIIKEYLEYQILSLQLLTNKTLLINTLI